MLEKLRRKLLGAKTDEERLNLERRLFLFGAAVTSAGLIVPRKVIVPVSNPSHLFDAAGVSEKWTWQAVAQQQGAAFQVLNYRIEGFFLAT